MINYCVGRESEELESRLLSPSSSLLHLQGSLWVIASRSWILRFFQNHGNWALHRNGAGYRWRRMSIHTVISLPWFSSQFVLHSFVIPPKFKAILHLIRIYCSQNDSIALDKRVSKYRRESVQEKRRKINEIELKNCKFSENNFRNC